MQGDSIQIIENGREIEGKTSIKHLLWNSLRGECSRVGVPTSSLELGVSLIYTKLPKNLIEHSISFLLFYHLPALSK